MNDGDAAALGVARTSKRQRLTIKEHLPLIVCVDATEDLHQGRLAGSVLPDQGVHLAVNDLE